jgi:multicomponent K+:H+ antiporter subunit D
MISHLPILPIIIPLLGGIFMLLPGFNHSPVRLRISALMISLILLSACIFLGWHVHMQGALGYAVGNWESPFGIQLYADRLAVILCLLTTFILICTQIYAFAGEDKQGQYYHPLLMFQVMGIQGAFLTGDIFNLFVFFEVLLISSYALMIHGGGKQKTQANVHYVILNLAGSALFLFALGILYGTFGSLNMIDMQAKVADLSPDDVILAKSGALLLLVVFGLKSAMLPLHFWLPKAYAAAPASVAALFSIMTKVGIYSLWRVHNGVFGNQAGELANIASPWILVFAVLTLFAGAIAALASQSLRTLTANLVIISVGSLLLMVALNSEETTSAGLYYLLHSTIATAAMFLLAGIIIRVRGKAEDRFVASRPLNQSAILGLLFFLCAIALIGMPPLSGFIGKALMLKASLTSDYVIWIWPGILLASLATMIILSRAGSTLFWRTKGDKTSLETIHCMELSSILILLAGIIALVMFAHSITAFCQLAADHLLAIGIPLPEPNIPITTAHYPENNYA